MSFRIMIPARYGSTRLPGKPLVLINGKPLIQHVYARACASTALDVVIVTDDTRIQEVAMTFGAKVCMTSKNHQSGSERIASAIDLLNWPDTTCVVNLQGDEPCMPASLINQAAKDLITHPDAVMATLATRIQTWDLVYDPNVVKVVRDSNGYALYFSRASIPWHREEFAATTPHTVSETIPNTINIYRHIGLYAYRAGFLREYINWPVTELEHAECLEQLRVLWYGKRIYVGHSEATPGPGVDVPQDIAKVAACLVTGQYA
ncbi:3-deoxy-manno-octulosonate cytidylyltransferase [Achromatium sp. WMS3]|nr:3-deoxy-manno-octulosonate cytidylyltransferase [Achromatium sp. WMS3]